ncbi:putative colanic acid biosynthesis acetyltransferase [Acidipila sp. EB88]|uniref:putative colanic acid biosynthesis acetyltransferase n=1 Tax=Acidipila sp. EB88 TaxID=2305226 RepID=UPI000F5FB1B5|nr:putative colanic acid biosynthesis acetyltransferase [Acidipila sp. EB88]RRA48804.1 putative colanic acid biosynthesis acetyltransferase [Acidipila sp. EB88]
MIEPATSPDPSAAQVADPTLRAAFSRRNRIMRLVWGITYALLYRPTPRPMHAWRAMLLRLFGAKLGDKCHFYAKGRIWAPWNLVCEDRVSLADDAELYNPSPFYFGSHAIVSQGAYVCGATHTYNDPTFPLTSAPMRFGAYSWVCARAIVSPGVNLGNGAILGLGSIATRDLEPFGVYAGVPAKKIRERERTAVPAECR